MADTTINNKSYRAEEGHLRAGVVVGCQAGHPTSSSDDRDHSWVGDQAQDGNSVTGRKIENTEKEEEEIEGIFEETEEEKEKRIREEKERKAKREKGGVKRTASGISKEIKKEIIEETMEGVVEEKKMEKGKKKKIEDPRSRGSDSDERKPELKKKKGEEQGVEKRKKKELEEEEEDDEKDEYKWKEVCKEIYKARKIWKEGKHEEESSVEMNTEEREQMKENVYGSQDGISDLEDSFEIDSGEEKEKERGEEGKGKEKEGGLEKMLEGRMIIYDEIVQKQHDEIDESIEELLGYTDTIEGVTEDLDEIEVGSDLGKIVIKAKYVQKIAKLACSEAGKLRSQMAVEEIRKERKEREQEKEKKEGIENGEVDKLRKRIEDLEREKEEMERKIIEERNNFTRILENYRKEKEGVDKRIAKVEKKLEKTVKECEKKEKDAQGKVERRKKEYERKEKEVQGKVEETVRKKEELEKEIKLYENRRRKLMVWTKERDKELERLGKKVEDWNEEAEELGCKLVEKETQTGKFEVTYKEALEMAKKGEKGDKKKVENEKKQEQEKRQEWSKVTRRGREETRREERQGNDRSRDRFRREEERSRGRGEKTQSKREEGARKRSKIRVRREAIIIRTKTREEGDEIMNEFRGEYGTENEEEIKAIRRTRNGNLLVEMENSGGTEELKNKIEKVAKGRAIVTEKKPTIDMEIDDIEAYIKKEEVMERVLVEYGEGDKGEMRLKVMKGMGTGMNRAVIEVPMAWRKKITEKDRIRIGYTKCRVKEASRVIRCFRCNDVGHISYFCRKEMDQTGACRRCGAKGHVLEECRGSQRCHVCAERGVPEHRLRHNAGTNRCKKEKEMMEDKRRGRR